MIDIKPDVSGAREYLKQLQTREIPRVVGRTLTRAGNVARTFSSRSFRQRINLKKATIDAAIKIKRGTNEIQNLSALARGRAYFEIQWSGKPFPLKDFAAKKTSRGVTFQVSRRQRRKVFRRQGRLGFIIEKLGGHVFVRVTDDPPGPMKAKIKKVFGPSIPQFAATRTERDALIAHVIAFWNVEIIRNARFALQRRGTL
jgi:hypothetical protein